MLVFLLLEVPGEFVLDLVLLDQEEHIRYKKNAAQGEEADADCGCHWDLWIIET
jgi:hypothetical protein